jgi:hypothetical protein
MAKADGTGTAEDPWVLKTPPGTSDYVMWRDDQADPPTLVCQVGSTKLGYQLRCIEDLHEMLRERGDRMDLGAGRRAETSQGRHRRGVGALPRQPGRRLVWHQEGPSRSIRDVRPAAPRSAGAGRARAQRPEQPDASALGARPDHHARSCPVSIASRSTPTALIINRSFRLATSRCVQSTTPPSATSNGSSSTEANTLKQNRS